MADSAGREARVYDGLLRARLFLVNDRIYIRPIALLTIHKIDV